MKFMKGMKNTTPKKVTNTGVPEKTQTASSGNGVKTVTIEAKIDVGFGNSLYLRGEGQGLSWSQGIPLTCVDKSTWKWSGEASDKVKFKLLLNDLVWSQGGDLVAAPGERVEVAPAF
jgi:hypothetical protein